MGNVSQMVNEDGSRCRDIKGFHFVIDRNMNPHGSLIDRGLGKSPALSPQRENRPSWDLPDLLDRDCTVSRRLRSDTRVVAGGPFKRLMASSDGCILTSCNSWLLMVRWYCR